MPKCVLGMLPIFYLYWKCPLSIFKKNYFIFFRHGSIIRGFEGKQILKQGLENLKQNNGHHLTSFLQNCHCVKTKLEANNIISQNIQPTGCNSIQEFEEMFVVYKKNLIEKTNFQFVIKKSKTKYDPLSTIRDGYLDAILANLESYMPTNILDTFSVFDNTKWGSEIPIQEDAGSKLKKLSEFYGLEYDTVVHDSWNLLIHELRAESYPYWYLTYAW